MPAAPRPRDVAHNVSEPAPLSGYFETIPSGQLAGMAEIHSGHAWEHPWLLPKGWRTALPAPLMLGVSGFQNRYDLVGVRIHNHDLLVDEDVFITTPFRIDRRDS